MPTLAHAGDKIAFFHRETLDRPAGIYLLKRSEGAWERDPMLLLSFSGTAYDEPTGLRFSPNGEWLLYAYGGIWALNVSTKTTEELVHGTCLNPDWNPNSDRIVFNRLSYSGVPGDSGGIGLVSFGTREVESIKDVHGNIAWGMHPRWSPDGRWILFDGADSKADNRSHEVYRVLPDSSDYEQLTSLRGYSRDAAWFGSTDEIVFISGDFQGYRLVLEEGTIQPFLAADDPISLVFPYDFSPDGMLMVMSRDHENSGFGSLWIGDLSKPAASRWQELTSFMPPDRPEAKNGIR